MVKSAKTPPVKSADVYSLMMFASQVDDGPYQLTKTHNFATFIHQFVDPAEKPLIFTISWLPDKGAPDYGEIKPWKKQNGLNWPQNDTFDWAKKHGMAIHTWQPFNVKKPEFFASALRQARFLDTPGALDYFFYGMLPIQEALNCTHALGDLDITGRLRPTALSGVAAGRLLLRHFREWISPSPDPDSVISDLKLPEGITWETYRAEEELPGPISPKEYFASDVA